MSIKQTQRVALSAIKVLDDSVWKQIAIKAITKMPRIQLTNESNKLIHDFALMNGHDPKGFLQNLSQQNEKKQTIIDNLLVGSIRKKPGNRKLSEGDLVSSQNPKKKQQNLNLRVTNRSITLSDGFFAKSDVPKICTKLFLSQLANEEQQIIEGQMRKSKVQSIRYNTRLQQLNRERMAKSQQHAQNQKKKFKETKCFTYDYEGRLLGTKVKQNGNMKFVHVKAKFNQSCNKEHRSFIERLHKSKCSEIIEKRIINGDDNQIQAARQDKYSKNIPLNLNNSLNDLFRDDKSIQMGVSIIDKATNSKIVNNRENPLGKSIKLSDFKKSFKSSSMVGRKKFEKLATLQPNTPNLSNKDFDRVKTVSEAESKILQSAFSRYSKQIGKININNCKAFMDSFYNDQNEDL